MPRLKSGEDKHIDKINHLVLIAKTSDSGSDEYKSSFNELLEIFQPLLYSVCYKWARYFNDTSHKLKTIDELMADAQYWFMKYTLEKYEIDGVATFNTFIKKHIDQRIRYIYETELGYRKKNVFPDTSKLENDEDDPLELVVRKYSDVNDVHMDNNIADKEIADARMQLAHRVIELSDSYILNDRERTIFKEIVYNGITHEEMSRKLNISRTRVTQILKRAKAKMYDAINRDEKSWKLIITADIDFEEN